jgi:hypothetical protein
MSKITSRRGFAFVSAAFMIAAFAWTPRASAQAEADSIEITAAGQAPFNMPLLSFAISPNGSHGTISLVRIPDQETNVFRQILIRGRPIRSAVITSPDGSTLSFTNLIARSQSFQPSPTGEQEIDLLAY